MTPQDLTDLEKRQGHLDYLLNITTLYANLKRRKSAPQDLKTQITNLEHHLAAELQEFLDV